MKILITGGNGNIAKLIYKNLCNDFDIHCLGRDKLNILNYEELNIYFENNSFDILIHTAILGGRRTKEDGYEIFYNNIMMFENILKFSDKFKMIINLDSAAIYDRNTDIFNRKEDELLTIPTDYYGFSKYIIYQRTLLYPNIFNFRIFNLFHINEENNRFIKSCFLAKYNNTNVTIFEDKYFDFISEIDFIKILHFYVTNYKNLIILPKTINICYEIKYKLSEIAKNIINDDSKINIKKINSINNYCGNNDNLIKLNVNLIGFQKSLDIFQNYIKN